MKCKECKCFYSRTLRGESEEPICLIRPHLSNAVYQGHCNRTKEIVEKEYKIYKESINEYN